VRPAKAQMDWNAPLKRKTAGIDGAVGVPQYPLATMYLFHSGTGSCTAPILFLTTTP